MPLVVKDRVRETTASSGTGAMVLSGAVLGYQGFSAIGDGNTVYYCVANPFTSEWEVGLGTYTASTNSLARTSVFDSSNGGAAVPFSVGVKDIFAVAPPADRFVDNQGNFATGTWNISISGNAATATSAASLSTLVSLTTGVTGVLPAANGGTGVPALGTGVATALGQNVSGSGGIALTTSPTFTTPNLGTPTAVTLTNATGLPIDGGTTGTLPAGRGGTGITALGTGVATALGVNTGLSGAFVVNGGALGLPSTGNLANCSNYPLSALQGLGTNVGTALAINVGTAGAVVVNGGALGTPSSGTLSSCTGLPVSTGISGLGAGVATFLATPSSSNLAAAVTGETGTGALVFATSPSLTTPSIGVATATSINGVVINRGLTNDAESIAIGSAALESTVSGADRNTCVGNNAGSKITNGTYNSCFGAESAPDIETGQNNIAVGRGAAKDLKTGNDNIYVGYDAKASASGASTEIVIGRNLTGKGNNTAFLGGSSGVYNEGNTTAWQTTSDQRIKREIVDAQGGLAIIDALRVRNFRYKTAEEMPLDTNGRPMVTGLDPDPVRIGFIAQELEQVLPSAVTTQSNGVRSVSLDPLHYHLIMAVQQLSARVAQLESRLATLVI